MAKNLLLVLLVAMIGNSLISMDHSSLTHHLLSAQEIENMVKAEKLRLQNQGRHSFEIFKETMLYIMHEVPVAQLSDEARGWIREWSKFQLERALNAHDYGTRSNFRQVLDMLKTFGAIGEADYKEFLAQAH